MKSFFFIVFAGSAPGVALLTYFYLKDRYQPEPLRDVLRLFALGFLALFPTLVIQRGLVLAMSDHDIWFAFFVSGAVEEFVKWFILYFTVFQQLELAEPYDAIVYAVAVSLGFATLENMIYIWSETASFGTMLLRGLLPVSGHALFGVIMGYYMAKAKFGTSVRARMYLLIALILPILWHGSFNFILLSIETWGIIIGLFMICLWLSGLYKVKKSVSPT